MLSFKFDINKGISVLLYISKHLAEDADNCVKPDFHKIFKILYFADQKHIREYGRPILGDHYIAMKDGPVPTKIYDILKIVRGDSIFPDEKFSDVIEVRGHFVFPRIDPDLDEISESEMECLSESMSENKSLSFNELKEKSHDAAYKKARKDDKISFIDIAKVAGANDDMISYMHLLSENEKILNAA